MGSRSEQKKNSRNPYRGGGGGGGGGSEFYEFFSLTKYHFFKDGFPYTLALLLMLVTKIPSFCFASNFLSWEFFHLLPNIYRMLDNSPVAKSLGDIF